LFLRLIIPDKRAQFDWFGTAYLEAIFAVGNAIAISLQPITLKAVKLE
jgi:hypothetical protein